MIIKIAFLLTETRAPEDLPLEKRLLHSCRMAHFTASPPAIQKTDAHFATVTHASWPGNSLGVSAPSAFRALTRRLPGDAWREFPG